MAFSLQPLTREDVPSCVSIYFAAFQNPHSLSCWPRTPGIRTWWENMMYDELDEVDSHWFKAVAIVPGHTGSFATEDATSTKTKEIVGFVKWQQPKQGVEPSMELPEWPEDADKALCEETFRTWARQHRDLMGARGHWYLEIVATSPAFQGKGAASQMIRWATARADQDGVEAFLEASPDAVALYEKHGFREAARTDTWIENERVKGTWYRNLFMIRQPQTKAI